MMHGPINISDNHCLSNQSGAVVKELELHFTVSFHDVVLK